MPCNNHLDLFDLAAMTPQARINDVSGPLSGPLTALMRACGGSHSGYIYIRSRPIIIDIDRPIL